ncbi:DUF922 domain-containing protein [Uliginosibacterium sp. H1]|uniref:DUF922 domain-containing protein n=1 Tax=Uliginosibacterium sp. H1 TaxID=3114757 RepID=UPI002E19C541|nr:DUF922 domain-containing protein [Uliginosibacterium sp. H1]
MLSPFPKHVRQKMRAVMAVLVLASLPRVARADLTEFVDEDFYTATVTPGSTALAALNAASPVKRDGKVFHGNTKWTIEWRIATAVQASGRCRITKRTVMVTTLITLPRLVGGTSAQQQAFDRFLPALKTHERGHQAIGKEAGLTLDWRLAALPEMDDCKQLEARANETGKKTIAEYAERDRRYDATTEHGRTQGAVFAEPG